LSCLDFTPLEDIVDGGTKVPAGYRDIVAWPAGIELAAIDKLSLAIEQEKIWRTGCTVSARNILGLVVAVREVESKPPSLLSETFRGIIGIGCSVIGRDRYNTKGS
jgi:hypothetical protein